MPAGLYPEGQRAIILSDKQIKNTTTPTSIVGSLSNPSLVNLANRPPSLTGNLVQVGTMFEIEILGTLSTNNATPGTITIAVKVGSTTVATVTTGTLPILLASEQIAIKLFLTVRSTGGLGTAAVVGSVRIANTTAAGLPAEYTIATAVLSPATVAFNAASLVDVVLTFSAALATNVATFSVGHIYMYDSL